MSVYENPKEEVAKPLLEKSLSLDPKLYEEKMKSYNAQYSRIDKWREVYFRPITEGSLRASVLCLLCVTVGTSLLSIPYTMKMCGVALGIIIFFISAGITHWTLNLIAETCLNEGTYDYTILCEKYYGNKVIMMTFVMCIINNTGSSVCWNMNINSLSQNLIEYMGYDDLFSSPRMTQFIVGMIIVLFIQVPFCTHGYIKKFHVLSIIGCVFILYVILVSMCEFPFYFEKNYPTADIVYFNFDANFIQTFCIFFFAFGNHSTIMNALQELSPKTDNRVRKLVNYTSYSEIIVYFVTMLIGYFSTFDMTNEVYINRDYQSLFMAIAKFCYILVMICNIGLYYNMISPYLEYLFNFKTDDQSSYKPLIVSIFYLTFLFFLSFLISKVTILISLLGATSQVYLIFVTPIILSVESFRMPTWKKICYWIFLFVAVSIGVAYLVLFFFHQFLGYEVFI